MVGVVVLVALLLRLLYLFQIRSNPFFDSPIIDAQYYRDLGLSLSHGEGTGRAPFMMPPLYPLFLAAVFRIAGPGLLLPHVLQFLLGALAAGSSALLAARLAGTTVGLVAGLLVATSRSLLFVEGDLLATPLALCLDLLFLLLLVRFLQEGRWRSLLGAGLAGGLAALTLPLVIVSLAASVAFLALRRQVRAALLLLVAIAVPILPVTWHNLRASGSLVWVSANGGINFYIGNNPTMQHTVALRPGPEWRRMNDLPLREAGIVHPAGRDRWFYRQGLRFWLQQPGMALWHTAQKVWLLLRNREIMRDFDFHYFGTHYAALLRWPWWNFALLLALAAVGIVHARQRSAGENLVLLFLVAYAAGITLFFVSSRYRAPLLPLLALFAAMGGVWCVQMGRTHRGRRLARALLLGLGVFLLSMLQGAGAGSVDVVEARYRVGTALQQKGDCDGALQAYRDVLQRDPMHALAMTHAAACEQQQGRVQAAVDLYERALQADPNYVDPAVNLANLAWAHDDSAAAEQYFELAIARDPLFAQSYAYHGLFQLSHGSARLAVSSLRRALALDPSWESLRLDLARALVASGEAEVALQEVRAAERLMGSSDLSELVRGDALQRLGREPEARAAWERGLRANPANVTLQARLRSAQGGR